MLKFGTMVFLSFLFSNLSHAEDATFFVKVNPAGTYLVTDSGDVVYDPYHNPPMYELVPQSATELDLTALYNDPNVQLQPGDLLSLESVGDFRYGVTDPGESAYSLTGVFSNGSGFLFPGPNSKTSPAITPSTYAFGLSTDIPQDFEIPRDHFVLAQIPVGATKLLFSAVDANFANNSDPNGDFGVTIKITVIKAALFEYKQLNITDGGRKIILPPPPPPPIPPMPPVPPKILQELANVLWSIHLTLVEDGSPLNTSKPRCIACGDPVNVANGMMWHKVVDFNIEGRTPETALKFKRTYLAHPTLATTIMGEHWFNNFQTSIYAIKSDGENNLIWVDENGGAFTFTRQANNTFQNPPDFYGSLKEFDDHYELKQHNKKYVFSRDLSVAPYGKLLSISETHGESITLSYDTSGNLVSAGTKLAGKLLFAYDSNGHLVKVSSDRDNLSYLYSYDSQGNLVSVTDYGGRTTKYNYLVSDQFYLNGLMTSITDPLGRKTIFDYSYDGRVISEIEPGNATRSFSYGEDSSGNFISEVKEIDGTISYFLSDSKSRVIKVLSPDSSIVTQEWNSRNLITKVTDQVGEGTQYVYGQNGKPISIKRDSSIAPTLISYDSKYNKPTLYTPPIGAPTQFSIDPNNGDVTQISQNNDTTELSLDLNHDQFGNIISSSNGFASFSTQTNSNGQRISLFDSRNPQVLSYDTRGRVITRTFKNGRVLNYSYDVFNRVTKISDSNGPMINFTYNLMGKLLSKEVVGVSHREMTKYIWDVRDRLVQKIDPLGRIVRYEYDYGTNILDKPRAIIDPEGKVTSFLYDNMQRLAKKIEANGAETRYQYDQRGKLINVTDALGKSTNFQYDISGHLIKKDSPIVISDNSGKASISREIINYSYDDNDRIVKETKQIQGGSGEVVITGFSYDSFNRMIRKKLQMVNQQNVIEKQEVSSFSYEDVYGVNLLKTANNDVENLTFLHELIPPYKAVGYSVHSANSSNPNGMLQGDFQLNLDYSGQISSVKDLNNLTLLTAQYDQSGRLLNINSGNIFGNSRAHLSSTIQYDDFGRKVKVQNSDGSIEQITYDNANQASTINWNQANMSECFGDDLDNNFSEQLSYDLDGNVVSNKTNRGILKMAYDNVNQVISENAEDYKRSYQYDSLGDRVLDSKRGTGHYLANALLSDDYSNFYYEEDSFGGMTSEVNRRTHVRKDYSYRLDGRLASVEIGIVERRNEDDFLSVNYSYDALGRRVSKKVQKQDGRKIDTFTQSFLYLADQEKILLASNGRGDKFLFLDGQGIDRHLGEVSAKRGKSYLTDHLGSVLNTEASKNRRGLGVFGNSVSNFSDGRSFGISKDSSPVVYGFAGREYDLESGLYYNRHRMYNPNIGRFTSRDPMGLAAGDMNLYRYAENNPQKFIDPSGECTLQLGVSLSIQIGPFNFSFSSGVAIDDSGNLAVYQTNGKGTGAGEGAVAGINVTETNANTVDDLKGQFYESTVTIGDGAAGSYEVVTGISSDGTPIVGSGITVGIGEGVSGSSSSTNTSINGDDGTPSGDGGDSAGVAGGGDGGGGGDA